MQPSIRTRRWAAFLAAALTLSIVACGSPQAPAPGASPTPAAGHGPVTQIVIAQTSDAVSLDPQKQSDTNTGNIVQNMFDGLLLRNKDISIQPALATEYKRLSDTQWELKLRQGVKFHDGEDFNADAVKFSFDRLVDPKTKAVQASYFTAIKQVEVVDPYTVRFTTNGPDLLFPARMTNLMIVPPQYIKEKGDDYFAKNPVGTGPYKFVEWVKDDRVVVTANDAYWGGKPPIQKVIWKPVPEMATRVAGLQGGQLDLVNNISPDQVKTIQANNQLKVVSTPSAQMQMLNFNIAVPPADNKEFRLAVSYAVNPKPIIEAVLGGYASSIDIPISNVIPGVPNGIQPLPYDPVKAKEHLAKAGLGPNVTIDLVSQNGYYPLDKDIAQAIAQQLAAVGITANVKPTEYSQYLTLLKGKKISPVFLEGGNNIWFDVDPQITAFYGTSGPLSAYSNQALDDLIAQARAGAKPEDRTAVYAKAYTLVRDEAAGLPILQYTLLAATDTKIDWKPRPDGRIRILEITPK